MWKEFIFPHVALNLIYLISWTPGVFLDRKHVLYTAIVQIKIKKTEEELDLCMIKVQKSKLIKIIRYDDDDRQTDRQMKLLSNTHGCELTRSRIGLKTHNY